VSKETYYSVKRDLLQCQKRPSTVSKETYYSVKRDLLVSKETYYRVKRDLLQFGAAAAVGTVLQKQNQYIVGILMVRDTDGS